MTERYAFLSHERHCQSDWDGQVWAVEPALDTLSALRTDIVCRQNGTLLRPGKPTRTRMGILTPGSPDTTAEKISATYGADAWRLAMILEKNPDTFVPYWRLIQKWHNLFKTAHHAQINVITMELQSIPETALLARAVRQGDFYHTLTIARTMLKRPDVPVGFIGAVLAPFAPHVLNDFLSDAPATYTALRNFAGETVAVTVDNRFVCMTSVANGDFDDTRKEVLKIPAVQRKIGQRQIRKCVYVPGKVFNVIC